MINQDDRKFYPNEFQRWRCRLAADCYPDWLPFYKVRGRCRLVIEMRLAPNICARVRTRWPLATRLQELKPSGPALLVLIDCQIQF